MGISSILLVTVVLASYGSHLEAAPFPDSCTTTQENGMTVTKCSDGKGGTYETRQGGFSSSSQSSHSSSSSSSNSFGNSNNFNNVNQQSSSSSSQSNPMNFNFGFPAGFGAMFG